MYFGLNAYQVSLTFVDFLSHPGHTTKQPHSWTFITTAQNAELGSLSFLKDQDGA